MRSFVYIDIVIGYLTKPLILTYIRQSRKRSSPVKKNIFVDMYPVS